MNKGVEVIAEAGSCAGGDQWLMHALLDTAKRAGANTVKFQWTSSHKKLEAQRGVGIGHYEALAFPREWLQSLSEHAHDVGMRFMCTVYMEQDIEVVAPFVDAFKVSAFEATDYEFIQRHEGFRKQVYVSTGMMTEGDIVDLRAAIMRETFSPRLLQCTSSYPTPSRQINLGTIRSYGFYGLSDHSFPSLPVTGAVAVAYGALAIEVHFRLEDTPCEADDYEHSRTPGELRRYIDLVRTAERLGGDGVKKVESGEKQNMKYRSVQS